MKYSEKLKDPRWQKKRLLVLERDEWTCQWCFDDSSTLHVHHMKYEGDPWDVADEFLITLCESCHKDIDEGYQEAGLKLMYALKSKGFASIHLIRMAESIEAGVVRGLPHEPSAHAVAFMFTDQQAWNLVYDRFFEYLKQKGEERKALCQTES